MNEILYKELCKLGIPVTWILNNETADNFIVARLLIAKGKDYSNDKFKQIEHKFRISIYSKGEYSLIVNTAIKLLLDIGAYGLSVEGDFYEEESNYFHVPIEFYLLEEVK